MGSSRGDTATTLRKRMEARGRELSSFSPIVPRSSLGTAELQVYVAPVFLGDGTRIFDVPGGSRVDWELIEIDEANQRSFGRTYRPNRR